MRKWSWMLAIVLVFVCLIAFGQDVDSEVGKTIDSIWTNVFYVIGIVLAGFITRLLTKLAKKYGIELNEKQQAMISNAAQAAIGYAEEWASRKIKLGEKKASAAEKFEKAVKKLCEKVPMLEEAKAKDIIVSNLPKFRAFIEGKAKDLSGATG